MKYLNINGVYYLFVLGKRLLIFNCGDNESFECVKSFPPTSNNFKNHQEEGSGGKNEEDEEEERDPLFDDEIEFVDICPFGPSKSLAFREDGSMFEVEFQEEDSSFSILPHHQLFLQGDSGGDSPSSPLSCCCSVYQPSSSGQGEYHVMVGYGDGSVSLFGEKEDESSNERIVRLGELSCPFNKENCQETRFSLRFIHL